MSCMTFEIVRIMVFDNCTQYQYNIQILADNCNSVPTYFVDYKRYSLG